MSTYFQGHVSVSWGLHENASAIQEWIQNLFNHQKFTSTGKEHITWFSLAPGQLHKHKHLAGGQLSLQFYLSALNPGECSGRAVLLLAFWPTLWVLELWMVGFPETAMTIVGTPEPCSPSTLTTLFLYFLCQPQNSVSLLLLVFLWFFFLLHLWLIYVFLFKTGSLWWYFYLIW